jgi:DeoR/GlpR family transcriptional regulator of sugar metabolism
MITFRSRFCNIGLVIPAQRRQRILDALREDGAVSIRALAAALETSAVTIRRDLDYLDSIGELTRTHGGALAGQPTRESPYSEKVVQARREKEAIGALAATLVADGDVVVIGPGTTTEVLAKALAQRVGLTVVTNSLLVAEAFGETTGNEVIVTGGTLRASIRALVGEATNHTLRGLNADLTFLSGNGMDAEFGLSTPNMTVADSDRSLAAAGNRVVALVDHTKFGVRTAIQTLAPSSITDLITDESSPPAMIAALRAAGIRVHIARSTGLSDTFSRQSPSGFAI